mmetsp:Transcript_6441/g.5534  ORF Transcript_6441/g.5534 Transcript_6441/m.5534 type:complete len:104 (+) Transcript_6441:445-756(+)
MANMYATTTYYTNMCDTNRTINNAMPNIPNIHNMPHMGSMPNIPNMANLANLANMGSMPNINSMGNIHNMPVSPLGIHLRKSQAPPYVNEDEKKNEKIKKDIN